MYHLICYNPLKLPMALPIFGLPKNFGKHRGRNPAYEVEKAIKPVFEVEEGRNPEELIFLSIFLENKNLN